MSNEFSKMDTKTFSEKLNMQNANTYDVIKKIARKLQIIPAIGSKDDIHSVTECIKNGFVVIDKDKKVKTVSHEIFDMLKMTYHNNNKTLFGNFENVANMSDEEYYTNQILHYFSTYGLESLGLKAIPYIPMKELWKDSEKIAKNVKENDKILVYMELSDEEYENELVNFILNIKAPNDQSGFYRNIFRIVTKDIDENDIRSYELKAIYYDVKGIFPKHPTDFLRYCVYLATGSTLLIKNHETIDAIKCEDVSRPYLTGYYNTAFESNLPRIVRGFKEYDLTLLASIFYRFKPIFLAFKTSENKILKEIKPIINRIRKLAPKYHKPLSGLCVQNLFEMAKCKIFSLDEIKKFIETMEMRDIFKLCNAYANSDNLHKVIGIRNGRAFVKNNEANKSEETYEIENKIVNILYDEIKNRLAEKFKDKVVIMPNYISYGLPISEKDLVGKYPNGTIIVTGEEPLSIGVSWNNKKCHSSEESRVDIDLHLQSATMHYGWNASRMNENTIIYSGDMTDARNGAAEAFYINDMKDNYIIDTRLYTGNGPIDMNLFISKRKLSDMNSKNVNDENDDAKIYNMARGLKYIYDPNEDIIPNLPLTIKNEGLNIGLYSKGKLYFYNKSISAGIVPLEHYESFIDGLVEKFENSLNLNYFFEMLNVPIYNDLDELKNSIGELDEDNVINLDPCIITEKTLFDLFEK